VAVPIIDEPLKRRVTSEAIDLALEDNSNAWALDQDGTYHRVIPGENEPQHLQTRLLDRLKG